MSCSVFPVDILLFGIGPSCLSKRKHQTLTSFSRMAEIGESVTMTSELGVSFHSDNYAKKQISTGRTEQLILKYPIYKLFPAQRVMGHKLNKSHQCVTNK